MEKKLMDSTGQDRIRVYDPKTGRVTIYPNLDIALEGEKLPKNRIREVQKATWSDARVDGKYWTYVI